MLLKSILLIIIGILSVPSFSRSEHHGSNIIGKISPYKGWIGLVALIWGIWSLISVVRDAKFLLDYGSFSSWLISIAMAIVFIVLGLILGFNLINQYILSRAGQSGETGRNILEKLFPMQKFFGIIAIIIGIVALVYIFVYPF